MFDYTLCSINPYVIHVCIIHYVRLLVSLVHYVISFLFDYIVPVIHYTLCSTIISTISIACTLHYTLCSLVLAVEQDARPPGGPGVLYLYISLYISLSLHI